MSKVKAPKSLRFEAAINSVESKRDRNPGRKISMAASLRAALFSVSYATLGDRGHDGNVGANDDSRNKGRARRSFRLFRSPLPKRGATPTRRPPGRADTRRTAAPLASRAPP